MTEEWRNAYIEDLTVWGEGGRKAANPNTSQGYLEMSSEELDFLLFVLVLFLFLFLIFIGV